MWTTKEELLTSLQQGDNNAFRYLYQQYYHMVEGYIFKNGGNQEDAKEIFQDAVYIVYKKLKENGVNSISVEISTYLFAVSKNLWFNKRRKNNQQNIVNFGDSDIFEKLPDVHVDEIELKIQQDENLEKIKMAMDNISKECKEIILNAYYKKMSTEEIATQLGYAVSFIKVKKYRCMEMLKQLFFNRKN